METPSFLNNLIDTKYNVLSLGAGVQSSTLALMAAHGEIEPMPDFAIFADTQAEPPEVYEWLEYITSKLPYPVYIVTGGNLTKDVLTPRIKKKDTGKGSKVGDTYMVQVIPLFGLMPNGKKTAAIGRKCTSQYKIRPILKKIKELCDIKRGQKETTVTQWIGISWDELQRMKESQNYWSQHRFPLIEKRMTRVECNVWMQKHGYPLPPRSACYYCPFHSDEDWRNFRDKDPEIFKKAIKFDEEIRQAFKEKSKAVNMEVYLHKSCKPLSEVDLDTDEDKGQQVWDFKAECEGMCGL